MTYYLASPTSPAPPPFLGMTKSETLPGFMVYEDLGSVSASTPTSLSPGLRRLSVVFPDASTDDTQRDLDECYSRVVSQARGRGANALTQVQVGRNEAGSIWAYGRAVYLVRLPPPPPMSAPPLLQPSYLSFGAASTSSKSTGSPWDML